MDASPRDVSTSNVGTLPTKDARMQQELVERARRGDHDGFEALISVRFSGLYALAQCILRDLDRTDDAVQDCLVSVWRKLPRLCDADRFDAWLRRLLVNACYDETRRAAPFAVDAESGAELWSFEIDRGTEKGPSIVDGVGSGSGTSTRRDLARGLLSCTTCRARQRRLTDTTVAHELRDRHPGRLTFTGSGPSWTSPPDRSLLGSDHAAGCRHLGGRPPGGNVELAQDR
jgi:hypothetical protein